MAAGKITLEANDGKRLSLVAPEGMGADSTEIVMSNTTLHDATAKATPVDADEMVVMDSASSFGLRKFTWANLKTVLFGSPSFTGTPTAPTAVLGDNSTKVATTEFVNSGRIIQYKQFRMVTKETTTSTNYVNSNAYLHFTPRLTTSSIVIKANVAGYINDTVSYMPCKLRDVTAGQDVLLYLNLHKHVDTNGYTSPTASGLAIWGSWGLTQKEFRLQFATSNESYTATLNGNGHGNTLNNRTYIEIFEIGA